MSNIINFLKSNKILLVILLIGVFFRTYAVVDRFEYAHDADLYSWIVKDILVDHHFRLIGQQTSAAGVYIGPLFYYLLVPFFFLFNMDPIGALVFSVILGIFTILSYYFVFKNIFNKTIGYITTYLYSVTLVTSGMDRWIVPTITTSLWSVWYFYILMNILKKDYSRLWILGVLIGLVWHIHIALVPTLAAVPVAIFFAKKLPNIQQFKKFLMVLVATNLPYLIFELKHGFSQTISIINNFGGDFGGGTGIYKLELILIKLSSNTLNLYFQPEIPGFLNNQWFFVFMTLVILGFVKFELLRLKQAVVLLVWILGPIIFFTISSSLISEYYFSNLYIIFLLILALGAYFIYSKSRILKVAVIILLLLLGLRNSYYLINQYYYEKGYLERKHTMEFIKNDAYQKGYPCISVNYITSPGENVGFRYLFWLNNMHVNQPNSGSPIYHIVIPASYSPDEVVQKFGQIGVIIPKTVGTKEEIEHSCSGQNSNLTDSMFGFSK